MVPILQQRLTKPVILWALEQLGPVASPAASDLVAALSRVGFQAKMPSGTYFLYVPAPKGCSKAPIENLRSEGWPAIIRPPPRRFLTGG